MNRKELVAKMAADTGLSVKDADKALASFMDNVKKAVKKGDSVGLVGFGTFEQRKRSARTGRNPLTGETLKIAAKKVPGFKAGKGFKDFVK
jgi:DNA-binding protein HU-beta